MNKTDIIIKSFNRPFYLDRCIYSIYENVSGNYTIKVLDDGTPEKYLLKIQEKYPEIIILKSENYNEKTIAIKNNIELGTEINGFSIPTKLWINSVKNASPYFIITEDDVWFYNKIDISELQNKMKNLKISLLKLGWSGNYSRFSEINNLTISPQIIAQVPSLFTGPKFIMNLFFYNKYKFFSILYRFKLVNNNTISKYWVLNSILMGMYKKEYWLKIWKNMDGKVDELQQLYNASLYYRKYKSNTNFICRLTNEVMKTTFKSSATGSYHKYGNNFDVNRFNHIINTAWYNREFDSMENFPKDFSDSYFTYFLDKANDSRALSSEWKKWADSFKQQYINIGCETE